MNCLFLFFTTTKISWRYKSMKRYSWTSTIAAWHSLQDAWNVYAGNFNVFSVLSWSDTHSVIQIEQYVYLNVWWRYVYSTFYFQVNIIYGVFLIEKNGHECSSYKGWRKKLMGFPLTRLTLFLLNPGFFFMSDHLDRKLFSPGAYRYTCAGTPSVSLIIIYRWTIYILISYPIDRWLAIYMYKCLISFGSSHASGHKL